MKLLQHITFTLFITSAYCLTNAIMFEPIENFLDQSQRPPSIDYESCKALNRYANKLFSMKEYKEASIVYQQAIVISPTCPELFFNLGQALYCAKKYPEALDAYKKAIKYKKDYCDAYIQIAQLMTDSHQPKNALLLLKKALTIEPHNTDARLKLARVYKDKARFNKAITILSDGLIFNPNNAKLIFELAHMYNLSNEFDKSLILYQQLNEQLPNNTAILHNIALTLKKMERVDEALIFYNRALDLNPDNKEALFSCGLAYLTIGDFEKGFAGYEHRHIPPIPKGLKTSRKPVWNGSDLHGKTILIHNTEQSFGDTLQFIRYAKLIKEKNGIVIAAVQTALVPLIKLYPHIDYVVSKDEPLSYSFDVHASIMSLPYILQTRLETIPHEQPYLHADEHLVDHWKKELSHDTNFKIGSCWQGNEDPTTTPLLRTLIGQKSVNIRAFAPFCAIDNVNLYSLQKTTGTDQLNDLPDAIKVITFDGDFDHSNGRFMDTAAVIKNLDLVITVDTSIGHLAAGLGVPTWVILPNPADWRWMIKRADSPWYPTMRLFRQPTPGDWETLIKSVAHELKKYITERKLHD